MPVLSTVEGLRLSKYEVVCSTAVNYAVDFIRP